MNGVGWRTKVREWEILTVLAQQPVREAELAGAGARVPPAVVREQLVVPCRLW